MIPIISSSPLQSWQSLQACDEHIQNYTYIIEGINVALTIHSCVIIQQSIYIFSYSYKFTVT